MPRHTIEEIRQEYARLDTITIIRGLLTYTDVDSQTHIIDVDSSTGGSVSPTGRVYVDDGDYQTFRFSPNSGYRVLAVYVDGKDVGSRSSYTFYDVSDNHTLYVDFARTSGQYGQYDIEASCSSGGYITPSGTISVDGGDSQTFRAVPYSGYEVAAIYVDGKDVGAMERYTFSNIYADHRIYAEFVPSDTLQHRLNTSSGSNGTISPEGSVWVARGTSKTFTFKPNSGYKVDAVYVDGEKLSTKPSTYTFSNIRESHSIYVEFTRSSYEVTADCGTGGTISPEGSVWVTQGTSKTFTFKPNSGYKVDAVYVDNKKLSTTPSSYTFSNVREAHSIYVEFARNGYEVTADCGTGGTISPEGSVWVTQGTSKTFTFKPDSGYKISAVYVDGEKLSTKPSSYTFSNVRGAHSIYVEFTRSSYNVTAECSSGGRITPSTATTTVSAGSSKTFTFTPNSGYGVLGVYVDDEYVGNSKTYTFKDMSDDHALYVLFAKTSEIKDEYDIQVSVSDGGTVSPYSDGVISVDRGEDQYFYITPDPGYHIAQVYVDDVPVSVDEGFNFKAVITDHELRVEFEPGIALQFPGSWINPYSDVTTNDWFYDSVRFMDWNGLITGTTATAFSPNEITTRGMLVTILYCLAGSPSVSSTNTFADVSPYTWYGDAATWAAQTGIVTGYSDGLFHADDPITREQLASILYRYAQYRSMDTSSDSDISSRFIDYPRISGYAVTAMSWAYANGIIAGTSSYTLSPTGTATRAETATMLARFCQNFLM
ncbi:S-layer homology domain-containing protein [Pseudoflavonifractor phocaeensis]|uniref:S-layer homology domain-containing protein n=1 Tax=Pseudoflavonifractor phocaeensis TaxID=1870988 RepID=UPI00195BA404|nr:S-layer homology domain-containing protein [Pseudoflavonifractor phocaeensis]MBM6927242.1 S-layer homology domain-containing protein [Pseudoflavonifractor phocaeensis]